MYRSPFRRLTSGIFALWFALSGAMRGAAAICPQHSASSPGVASAAARSMSHHHGIAVAGKTHGGNHHGSHCNCSGDCCGPSATSAPEREQHVAIGVRWADVRATPVLSVRQFAREAHVLPYPTAPPQLQPI